MFPHGFKESRLGTGRRPVDFVGQQKIREHRTSSTSKLSTLLLEHRVPGDVGRHEIGRELDAAESQIQALGEGADEEGLGQTRHAFQQAVSTSEESHQDLINRFFLPNHNLTELVQDQVFSLYQLINCVDIIIIVHLSTGIAYLSHYITRL